MVEFNLTQSRNGIPLVLRQRQEYVRLQRRLNNLCVLYGNGQYQNNMLGFLTAIGHTIKF